MSFSQGKKPQPDFLLLANVEWVCLQCSGNNNIQKPINQWSCQISMELFFFGKKERSKMLVLNVVYKCHFYGVEFLLTFYYCSLFKMFSSD